MLRLSSTCAGEHHFVVTARQGFGFPADLLTLTKLSRYIAYSAASPTIVPVVFPLFRHRRQFNSFDCVRMMSVSYYYIGLICSVILPVKYSICQGREGLLLAVFRRTRSSSPFGPACDQCPFTLLSASSGFPEAQTSV